MSFRVEFGAEARRQVEALPARVSQRARAELELLTRMAAILLPPDREVPPRAAHTALPGCAEVDGLLIHYEVDWEARILRVAQLSERPPEWSA